MSRILVIGSGARENALANALLQSPAVAQLWITPANAGVLDSWAAAQGIPPRWSSLDIPATDGAALAEAAAQLGITLAVVGPEAPLCAGVADRLRAAGVPTVGPGADAARLEGSKLFAKEFMAEFGIPTAGFAVFDDLAALSAHFESRDGPVVLKADGLAAGKGVIVCDSREEALEAAQRMLGAREFGAAADRVLVEERIYGREISFTCLLAGGRAEVLPPSSDYKRLRDGDRGPNTGGMGNMAPTPYATDAIVVEFAQRILSPFMRGLAARGLDYRGFLFVGTMATDAGLKVIEFNVRFGDPEAAVVLPLCDADWPAVLSEVAAGRLPQGSAGAASAIRVREAACLAVVLASANYPAGPSEPAVIEGLERVAARGLLTGPDGRLGDVQLLHAGTTLDGQGRLLVTGGRVLTISARAESLSLARRLAYEVAGNIRFDGMQLRSDIGRLE